MRQNHPLSDAPLTLSEFLSASHLHVATSSADVRFVDNILSGQRFSRKIAVTTSHWLTLPFVLVKTDLISVVSEKMASTPLFSGLQRIELRFEAQPVSGTSTGISVTRTMRHTCG